MSLFKQTWGYAESFIITTGVLIFSFLFEIAANYEAVSFPGRPYNIILLLLFILILLISYIFYKHSLFVHWISGVPASVSSIILFSILALLTAIIPQDTMNNNDGLGDSFQHLLNSWIFIIPFIYFLTVLGFVIIRKSWTLKKRNLGFLANHLGLWIVLVSAGLGSSDLQRYTINLEEGKSNNVAYNVKAEYIRLPFSIKLLDFQMVEYPPKIALGKFSNNRIDKKAKNNMCLLEKGKTQKVGNYNIEVKEYFNEATYDSVNGFIMAEGRGAVPAALISIKNEYNSPVAEGWISSGGSKVPAAYVPINDIHFLTMIAPEPKSFISSIEVYSKNKTIKAQLIVNKPISINSWQLYQMDYDTDSGKHSNISIIEAIKDPWLPFVYTGFFMVIAGSLYLFWKGRNLK